jgi:hypothetical protein
LEQIFLAQQQIVLLETELAHVSYFGEIRLLLEHAWKELGLPAQREAIRRLLQIRQAQASAADSLGNQRLTLTLTVLFGVLSTLALGESVVRPLWIWLALPRPISQEAMLLASSAIAAFVTAAMVAVTARRARNISR